MPWGPRLARAPSGGIVPQTVGSSSWPQQWQQQYAMQQQTVSTLVNVVTQPQLSVIPPPQASGDLGPMVPGDVAFGMRQSSISSPRGPRWGSLSRGPFGDSLCRSWEKIPRSWSDQRSLSSVRSGHGPGSRRPRRSAGCFSRGDAPRGVARDHGCDARRAAGPARQVGDANLARGAGRLSRTGRGKP